MYEAVSNSRDPLQSVVVDAVAANQREEEDDKGEHRAPDLVFALIELETSLAR